MVQMSGFMSVEEAKAFAQREFDLASAAGFQDGEYDILFEIDGAMIQSQEVVAAFQTNIATARMKARRIAVVAGASLTRRQAQRILRSRDSAAVFAEVRDAEQWLSGAK